MILLYHFKIHCIADLFNFLKIIIELKYQILVLDIIFVIGIISFASKIGKEVLDITSKIVATAAGATVLYQSWTENGDKEDDDKDNKTKNKKDSESKDTKKTDESK